MMGSRFFWACLLSGLVAAPLGGCGDDDGDGGFMFNDGGGGRDLGPGVDGGSGSDGGPPPPVNACAPGCGPTELCGDGDGNGLDDNCDGRVDEECRCTTNNTRPCFAGPPDRRGVGTCADGIETCDEFGVWGPCVGGVVAASEVCDGADNDCNGITDDGISACTPVLSCPNNDRSTPLSTYPLMGGRIYTGTGSNWSWRIECPPSVPADLCPAPTDPSARDTSVYFTASGAYRVYVSVTTDDGMESSCAWTVAVGAGGLRVELNWDSITAGTDVDLHLHRWTTNGTDTDFFNADDCYYGNCTPTFGTPPDLDWGYPISDLSACENAPHGKGPAWRMVGGCPNPRLDVDTNGVDGACSAGVTDPANTAFCAPENINLDNPTLGMPYRVMVNYYADSVSHGPTYPSVNIYCGGALRGAFGLDPLVTITTAGELFSSGPANDNWYVADVVFFQGECGLDCYVYPLGTILRGVADPTDPFSSAVATFGPPWSCNYDATSEACL